MADDKYGDIDPRTKLHEDEPYFFLRAQDVMAPAAVDAYAGLLEVAGRTGAMPGGLREAERVRAYAARMRGWQAMNSDKVKLPD